MLLPDHSREHAMIFTSPAQNSLETLLHLDRAHVLHPYSSMTDPLAPLAGALCAGR